MKDNDEELIARFFADNRQEIADDGFTRRVMERLPGKALWLNRLWTAACMLVGLGLFVLLDGAAAIQGVWLRLSGDLAGSLASFEFGGVSPFLIYLGVLSTAIVAVYNMAESTH